MSEMKHTPPNGKVVARTVGRRSNEYRVLFVNGEALEVEVRVRRPGCQPFYRVLWHRANGPMSTTVACAVRAAIKATA